MLTMQEVRRQYPSPVSSMQGWRPGGVIRGMYCVGGAFVLARETAQACPVLNLGFPVTRELAIHLEAENPTLSTDAADALAEQIITANDAEDFEEAWHVLDRALKG